MNKVMDLDEAIKHCDEVAKRERKLYEEELTDCLEGCIKCAKEHEQLAEWLKELKAYRELFESPEEAKRTLEQLMV